MRRGSPAWTEEFGRDLRDVRIVVVGHDAFDRSPDELARIAWVPAVRAVRFRAVVEPPEPMRGLEVPAAVVEAIGGGARPAVTITINGHRWRSRIAIMRGRHLIGLSNANRTAAGVEIGESVEVALELDAEPRVVAEPEDLTRALDADPAARAAFDRLSQSRRRELVLAIDGAKRPETRARRIAAALTALHEPSAPRSRRSAR